MIRNICGGCMGFVGKDGYCQFCGSYYPDFDVNSDKFKKIELSPASVKTYEELQDSLLNDFCKIKMEINGEKVCPCEIESETPPEEITRGRTIIYVSAPFTIKTKETLFKYWNEQCTGGCPHQEYKFVIQDQKEMSFVGTIQEIWHGTMANPREIAKIHFSIEVFSGMEIKEYD